MSTVAQIILVSVITLVSIVLSLVGFQAFMLLKDLRSSIRQTNKIISDVDHVTSKISHSADSVSGMFDGMQAVMGLVGAIKKVRGGTDEK